MVDQIRVRSARCSRSSSTIGSRERALYGEGNRSVRRRSTPYDDRHVTASATAIVRGREGRRGLVPFADDAGRRQGQRPDPLQRREPTYFASPTSPTTTTNSSTRGFNTVIDVWGADHQGHVARTTDRRQRLSAATVTTLEVLLYQLVHLRRGERARPHVQAHRRDSSPCASWSRRSAQTPPASSCSSAPPTPRWISTWKPRPPQDPAPESRSPTSSTPTPAAPASFAPPSDARRLTGDRRRSPRPAGSDEQRRRPDRRPSCASPS